MLTVFCKENEVNKHRIIESFPNPQIKTCVNKEGIVYRLHIIYPEDKIQIKPLTEKESLYYCGRKDNITMITLNWIPTELIVGVNENKRFSESTELSKKTGYLNSVNTGSSSRCFLTSKVQNAIDILVKAGFEIDNYKRIRNEVITLWVEKLNKIGYLNARIYIDEKNVSIFCGELDKENLNYETLKKNLKEFEEGLKQKIFNDYSTKSTNI